jgi:hypothetical protein
MSFPGKSDVKSHLSRHVGNNILPFRSVIEADSTGHSLEEQNPSSPHASDASLPRNGNVVVLSVIRKLPA